MARTFCCQTPATDLRAFARLSCDKVGLVAGVCYQEAEVKTIPLTQGRVALVDDERFEEINRHKWYLSTFGYAVRNSNGIHRLFGGRYILWMHREIMRAPASMQVDHINGDTLDNRVSNLRICSNTENSRNQRLRPSNTSGYKGVAWRDGHKKFRARITVNYKDIFLGYFDDPKEAARAYDSAARKYFGEFAKVNFPDEERKE